MGLDAYFSKTRRKEVGYFRKVNFLVSFFSEINEYPIGNLSPVRVDKEDCEELLRRCNIVLESKTDEISEKLLPYCTGLFFGSYEYDDGYYENVKLVKRYLENELLPMFDDLDDDEVIEFEIWY